jgi:hypothetical protein
MEKMAGGRIWIHNIPPDSDGYVPGNQCFSSHQLSKACTNIFHHLFQCRIFSIRSNPREFEVIAYAVEPNHTSKKPPDRISNLSPAAAAHSSRHSSSLGIHSLNTVFKLARIGTLWGP